MGPHGAALVALARVADLACGRDGHGARVAALAVRLGSMLDMDDLEGLRVAAQLHDLGKTAVSPVVLAKPGPLTEAEREAVREHTHIGHVLLRADEGWLRRAALVALLHHERWDGAGYYGLVGRECPLEARVVAVADAYDAMTGPRLYREAWDAERAVAEVRRLAGRQFDPEVARLLTDGLG